MFAIGSIITPFFLGMILGAITVEQPTLDSLFMSWVQPFPIFTGLLTLVICAYLAAVYLINETNHHALQEDFRTRALISGVALLFLTILGTVVAYFEAPILFHELTRGQYSIPLQVLTGVVAIGALLCLVTRQFQLARIFAILQVVLILKGWMITQIPRPHKRSSYDCRGSGAAERFDNHHLGACDWVMFAAACFHLPFHGISRQEQIGF